MSGFDDFWKTLTASLTHPRKIQNWTRDSGYLNRGDFQASYSRGDIMQVALENGSTLNISKSEFEYMYDNWSRYKSGKISRGELRNDSRFTKYTISILKEFGL